MYGVFRALVLVAIAYGTLWVVYRLFQVDQPIGLANLAYVMAFVALARIYEMERSE
jgi:predicted PurR-regulated permease PerM